MPFSPKSHLRRPILLSMMAALVTIGMKSTAYALTGSAGLLSDALESFINLIASVTAYICLVYASRPADPTHAYGHEKIEYFSSGLEGVLIFIAGFGTVLYAIDKIIRPQKLESLEIGAAIGCGAAVINFFVARILLHKGRQHNSIVLEADGQHLMSDVLTTIGVVVGLFLVSLTDLMILDPIMAILVGFNIAWTGSILVRRSFDGLMDHALPEAERERIREIVLAHLPPGATFHALRTRQAGARRFAEFHMLVAGSMMVRDAHIAAHIVEDALTAILPEVEVVIHIEPIEEPGSWEPEYLERLGEKSAPELPHAS